MEEGTWRGTGEIEAVDEVAVMLFVLHTDVVVDDVIAAQAEVGLLVGTEVDLGIYFGVEMSMAICIKIGVEGKAGAEAEAEAENGDQVGVLAETEGAVVAAAEPRELYNC